MSDINAREVYFNGQEVLTDDLFFDQTARIDQDRFRSKDFWTDGVLKDPNGLSNMVVSVDATTNTLLDVSHGTAYSSGYRIAINNDLGYSPNFLTQTTNGICTPFSSGNHGVPLASYQLGQPNYVWARYVEQVSTGREEISFSDGSIHFPEDLDGYGIFVTTTNPPGNPIGLTNAVYLATVLGQGVGNPLIGAPNGLTDSQKVYSSLNIQLPAIGNSGSLVLANGSVRGSTANQGGSQREILQGTVSSPDLRPAAVIPSTVDASQNFTVNGLTVTTGINTNSITSTTAVIGTATVTNLGAGTASVTGALTADQIIISDPSNPILSFVTNSTTTSVIDSNSVGLTRVIAKGGSSSIQFITGGTPSVAATIDTSLALSVNGTINTNSNYLLSGSPLFPIGSANLTDGAATGRFSFTATGGAGIGVSFVNLTTFNFTIPSISQPAFYKLVCTYSSPGTKIGLVMDGSTLVSDGGGPSGGVVYSGSMDPTYGFTSGNVYTVINRQPTITTLSAGSHTINPRVGGSPGVDITFNIYVIAFYR